MGWVAPSGWCCSRSSTLRIFHSPAQSCRADCTRLYRFGLQPTISRWGVSDTVVKSAALIVQEGILKVIFSLTPLYLATNFKGLGWSLAGSLRMAGIPAVLYGAQNLLTMAAYQNVDAITFNILNQSKLVWTAVFLRTLLGIRLAWNETVALILIMSTTVLVGTDPAKISKASGAARGSENFGLGVVCTLAGSMLSGLSSTLIQYNLQNLKRNSYLMSAELGAYTCLTLCVKVAVEAVLGVGDGAKLASRPFFEGFTQSTWVPLTVSALGGIVVGQVTRHMGGLGKAYGILAGLIVSSLVSVSEITWRLAVAAPLVAAAFWLRFVYPQRDKRSQRPGKAPESQVQLRRSPRLRAKRGRAGQ